MSSALQLPGANFLHTVIRRVCSCLLCSCALTAEGAGPDWQGQLYGGAYYGDVILGGYGIASTPLPNAFTLTGELMHERYTDGDRTYTFSGVGGHLLWQASESARFGLIGSHSRDEYDYDDEFEDPNSAFDSNTVGLEGEIDHSPLTIAAQVGRVSNDYYSGDYGYLSTDIYYWGADDKWYARGALRRSRHYKEYTLEAYRALNINGLPLDAYVGITRNDLSTKEEALTLHTQEDSVYAGANIEFLTTTSSSWNLWFEGALQESDTVLSVELLVTFGPGVDAPYISAFGFTQ